MSTKNVFSGEKIEATRKGKFFDTTYFIYVTMRDSDSTKENYLSLNFKCIDRSLTSSTNFKKLLELIDSSEVIQLVFKGELENCFIHENFAKSKAVSKFLDDDSYFNSAFRAAVVTKYWIENSKSHDIYTVESKFERLIKDLKKLSDKESELLTVNKLTEDLFQKSTNFLAFFNLSSYNVYSKDFDLCCTSLDLIKEKVLLTEMLTQENRHDTFAKFLKKNISIDPKKLNIDRGFELIFKNYEDFIKTHLNYKNMTSGQIVYRMLKEHTASEYTPYIIKEPEDYSKYYTAKHVKQICLFPHLYLFDVESAEIIYNNLYKLYYSLFILDSSSREISFKVLTILFKIKDNSPYFKEWCDNFLNTLVLSSIKNRKHLNLLGQFRELAPILLSNIYDFTRVICNKDNFGTPIEWLMSLHLSEETIDFNNYVKSLA